MKRTVNLTPRRCPVLLQTKSMEEHPDAEPSGISVLHTLGPIDVDRCRSLKELVESEHPSLTVPGRAS